MKIRQIAGSYLTALSLLVFLSKTYGDDVDGIAISGRILCRRLKSSDSTSPVPFTEVKMFDKDSIWDDKMGTGWTDEEGYFTVTGQGRDAFWLGTPAKYPDPYIRVEYNHRSSKAEFEIVDHFPFSVEIASLLVYEPEEAYDKSDIYPNMEAQNLDIGELVFDSERCSNYLAVYSATHDFNDRVGHSLPYGKLRVYVPAPVHNGVPFAPYDSIWVPPGYRMSDKTAQHELAHTVRHWYDGDLGHFLTDTVEYQYPRFHSCGLKSNPGFAFNEGWAEFWAEDCYGFSADGPMDIEGNVAAALRDLQQRCDATSYDMWQVLGESSREIHSFQEYEDRFSQIIGCD